MKIVIPGGTGFLGEQLMQAFLAEGHEVVVLGRRAAYSLLPPARYVQWDAVNSGDWSKEIDGADVVVNVTGKSVKCFYDQKTLEVLRNSRILSTKAVGRAIEQSKKPPSVWLQFSAVGIYSHRFDAPPHDEATGKTGSEPYPVWTAISQLVKDWEKAAHEAKTPHTRKVIVRCGVVMASHKKSAFHVLLTLSKWGLGGSIAGGKHMWSWIHKDDFVKGIRFLIKEPSITGPVNLTAPHPVPQKELMHIIRKALGVRFGLPAAQWMVVLSSYITRIDSEMILKSRYVVPKVLLDKKFSFRFPHWADAVKDLSASSLGNNTKEHGNK